VADLVDLVDAPADGGQHDEDAERGDHYAGDAADRNAPTKLSAPEIATAVRGFSAPVAIDVAIALPVSWKPLVKSKASAVMTTSTSTVSFLTMATVNLA